MLNREKFDNEIAILESVASKHENDDFRTMVEKIKNLREQFEVKIMMIGHFNAGKSALLNCLIQRDDFLTEAQVPQTAVATELKFSENENYFAHMNDGSMVKLQNHNDFSPQACDHVEYLIPAANLKRLSDFTFVDTPGFDSGVDAHNKALSAYIGQGAAYILVCDIGKGGLSENTIAFLNEISQYSKRIAIVLNKTDIHIDEDNEQVLEEVIDTLHINGYDFPVITTSKFDEKAEEKIMCLIDSFCAQDVFDEKMRKSIESETSNMKNVLTVAQKNLHVDTYDLDLKIKKYQEAYDYLQESFEKQKNNFESEVPQITEEIIANIRNELNAKSYDVAKALAIGGTTGLEAIVVEIVRPVIISSMKEVAHQHLDAIVKTIDFSPLLNVEETKEVGGIVVNLASGIRDLIDNGSFVKAISVFERKDDKNQKKEGVDGKQIYQIATGIAAIATDIIA
ncbi:MAG: dynamin family protein, partial [Lentisphaeria bacterium]|nr:dynamin family protein [Lentisphaeria bacterium]